MLSAGFYHVIRPWQLCLHIWKLSRWFADHNVESRQDQAFTKCAPWSTSSDPGLQQGYQWQGCSKGSCQQSQRLLQICESYESPQDAAQVISFPCIYIPGLPSSSYSVFPRVLGLLELSADFITQSCPPSFSIKSDCVDSLYYISLININEVSCTASMLWVQYALYKTLLLHCNCTREFSQGNTSQSAPINIPLSYFTFHYLAALGIQDRLSHHSEPCK